MYSKHVLQVYHLGLIICYRAIFHVIVKYCFVLLYIYMINKLNDKDYGKEIC